MEETKREGEKRKKKRRATAAAARRGGSASEGDATPPKDRNASGERYLAPPDGRIRKLVSGVSLYGETPRLEGRWRMVRGTAGR